MQTVLPSPTHHRTPRTPPPAQVAVSLVLPAFNESAVVAANLALLVKHMESLHYDWEIVVINDGSSDDTGELARQFSAGRDNVFVFDHAVNFGLGQALKFAFSQCRGNVIVVLDVDLSYSPDHIEKLVARQQETGAKIVLASPYIEGGSVQNVPALRRWLSVGANRFLSFATHGKVKTLTGMVRAYDARFLRSLDFYSMGMEVNSEILYKAMILRARIEEIPATLCWRSPDANVPARRSSMRIFRQIRMLLVTGFLIRPVLFFLIPSMFALLLAIAGAAWFVVKANPITGVAAAVCALAAVQLLGCGLVSLQNKCYFEQMFHLGTTTYRAARGNKRESV